MYLDFNPKRVYNVKVINFGEGVPVENTSKSNYKLTYLFMLTYLVSYITRINYGTVIAEMVVRTHFSKALLSMALTGSFVTYGVGQLISGKCGDRFQPKVLVFAGLLVTTAMNLLIPLCRTPYQMAAVWCVNGFAQAFMWPPIVRLMAALLTDEEYKRASVVVSWGSSVGTIVIYLAAPAIISLSSWKGVFLFSAAASVIMAFVWQKLCCNIDMPTAVYKTKDGEKGKIFTPLFICIMLAIILQGSLRDGVTTWLPSYISETYNLSSVISILTSVVLPIFSIICFQAAAVLYRKVFKNPLMCSAVIFAFGAVSATLLFAFSGRGAALSLILAALLTGCMHGVNLILICMIPAYYKARGNVSTISGILNSCTYIGSAISTYAIAIVSENIGWHMTVGMWALIALAGAAVCAVCVRPWKRQF